MLESQPVELIVYGDFNCPFSALASAFNISVLIAGLTPRTRRRAGAGRIGACLHFPLNHARPRPDCRFRSLH